MMFNFFSKDDVLDDTLFHFFTYVVTITGFIVWAVIKQRPATPMSMYALFLATVFEIIVLVDLSDWSFIYLLGNKEEKPQ